VRQLTRAAKQQFDLIHILSPNKDVEDSALLYVRAGIDLKKVNLGLVSGSSPFSSACSLAA
jgi:hypothetical protein